MMEAWGKAPRDAVQRGQPSAHLNQERTGQIQRTTLRAVVDVIEVAMSDMPKAMVQAAVNEFRRKANGQVVLVLQGGGALGAYQVGVYQALHEAGVEPDWIIGTSIGAINASIIAGNEPPDRLTKLDEFWKRMRPNAWPFVPAWTGFSETWSDWSTLVGGIPAFFTPNLPAFWGAHIPLGADGAGFYSTAALRKTLAELVDCSIINKRTPRLTVGAANVQTGMMHYFDSRQSEITTEQITASGALPPAFPAVYTDGEFYWDGGILSNTPIEVIFDDNPRRNSLIFAVQLWNPKGPAPQSIWEVLNRQKDIQFSSRIASHIIRLQQTHRLRHVISQLVGLFPDDVRKSEAVRELANYGCVTQMHVVRLLAPRLENENHTKDVDFSPGGIGMRREAGYGATMRALERAPWQGEFDPIEGIILHRATQEEMMAKDADPFALGAAAKHTVAQAVDTYFDFLKKSVSSFPSGGTELGETLKDQGVENITAVHEFVKNLSKAKDFEEALRIQTEFTQSQLSAFGRHAVSIGEACRKAAADAVKKPSS
jgi:NTE family protein